MGTITRESSWKFRAKERKKLQIAGDGIAPRIFPPFWGMKIHRVRFPERNADFASGFTGNSLQFPS
jgi:hypothetical protein